MKPPNTDISIDKDSTPSDHGIVPDHTPTYSGACSPPVLHKYIGPPHNDIGGSMVPSDFEDFDDEIESYQDDFFTDCISDTEFSPFNTPLPQNVSQQDGRRTFQHPGTALPGNKTNDVYQQNTMTDTTKSFKQSDVLPSNSKSSGVYKRVSLPPTGKKDAQKLSSASSRLRAKSTSQCGGVSEVVRPTTGLQVQLSRKKRLIDDIYNDSANCKRTRVSGMDHASVTSCKSGGGIERKPLSHSGEVEMMPLAHSVGIERMPLSHKPGLSGTVSKNPPTLSGKLSSKFQGNITFQQKEQHVLSSDCQPLLSSHSSTYSTTNLTDPLVKLDTISKPPVSMTPKTCSFFTARQDGYETMYTCRHY